MTRRLLRLFLITALIAASVQCYARASVNGSAWPQMMADPQHDSYSTDPAIGASSAFGIKWMTNLYSQAMGSPSVAYNAALGKTVVYVGDERADFFAIDASNGNILWSINLGVNDKIEDTPIVTPDGAVWIGTAQNATVYKLNPSSGAIECSIKSPLPVDGSIAYGAPSGGTPSIYWAPIDTPQIQGLVYATNEATCAQEWTFNNYARNPSSAGSWATPAYGVSASGEPLIFVGTADSDSTEYAIDANTGARVWDYEALNPYPYTYDIGDASTVSAPGNNGIADGAVYVDSKYGYEYALDMSTGTPLWQYEYAPGTKAQSSRSAAALAGQNLVVGYGGFTGFGGGGGVVNFNAATGSVNWQYTNPDSSEVLSSVAVVGQPGSQVVAFGDIAGQFQLLNMASGASMYNYQTGGYITSSPAEANGTIFIVSSDGFLYAFAPNGSTASAPAVSIAHPVENATLPNPNGGVNISGTATDQSGVAAVSIAIEQGGASGPWYNASTNSFQAAPVANRATVAKVGATSTTWSYRLPIAPSGGTYEVYATPIDTHNVDGHEATTSFTVSHSSSEPNIIVSDTQVAPAGTFTVSANGFAPNEPVQISLFGTTVATATSSSTGQVPATPVTVGLNLNWQFGPTSLTLTGQNSGDTSTATITITNQWLQGGHDATRLSEEPNDMVINKSLSVGNGSVLQQSWYYPASGAVNSSPSVSNGVALFGNDSGTLTAVSVATGAAKWQYHIPSGAQIRSAPAVNALQETIVSAGDGNVYFVNSQTGTLLHSASVGGHPTSVATNGTDTYVASDIGKLLDISASTGKTKWTATLSGAGHSAPSLTTSAVVVGDDSGAISAFNPVNGALLWKATTGGAVTASPMIANNTVYVGSADGNLYALNVANGATLWTYKLTGAIVSNAALYGTAQIGVGDVNGQFDMLNANGQLVFHIDTQQGSPIVGISTVYSNTFLTLANGTVGMIRTDGPEPFAWSFTTHSTLSTQVAIVDGTVYVGAADGGLYAFTPQGATPMIHTRNGATISVNGNTNGWSCAQTP